MLALHLYVYIYISIFYKYAYQVQLHLTLIRFQFHKFTKLTYSQRSKFTFNVSTLECVRVCVCVCNSAQTIKYYLKRNTHKNFLFLVYCARFVSFHFRSTKKNNNKFDRVTHTHTRMCTHLGTVTES